VEAQAEAKAGQQAALKSGAAAAAVEGATATGGARSSYRPEDSQKAGLPPVPATPSKVPAMDILPQEQVHNDPPL